MAPKRKANDPMTGLHQKRGIWYLKKRIHRQDGSYSDVRQSLNTKDRIEAIRLKFDIEKRIIIGSAEDGANEKGPLRIQIMRYLEYKRQSGKHRKATQNNAERWLENFAKYMGDIHPAQITRQRAEKWYHEQRATSAESSAAGYLSYVKGLFSWMTQRGVIVSNPFADIRPPKIARKGRVIWATREQRDMFIEKAAMFDQINAATKASRVSNFGRYYISTAEMRFILYCGFHAGLRLNEIINARADWFVMDAKKIVVPAIQDGFESKDREAREVPLSDAFLGFLETYQFSEPYMIKPHRKQGASRYRYDPKRPWDMLRKECGMPNFPMHGMRHTFATLALKLSKWSISDIAMCLGDDVETARKHYIHHMQSEENRTKLI